MQYKNIEIRWESKNNCNVFYKNMKYLFDVSINNENTEHQSYQLSWCII